MVLGEGNLCFEKGFSLSQERGSLCLRMKDFFVSRERRSLSQGEVVLSLRRGNHFVLGGEFHCLQREGSFCPRRGVILGLRKGEISMSSKDH